MKLLLQNGIIVKVQKSLRIEKLVYFFKKVVDFFFLCDIIKVSFINGKFNLRKVILVMKSSLVRKIAASAACVSTSIVCSAPTSCIRAMDNSAATSVSETKVSEPEVSKKNRTVATVLGFLFPTIGNWYEGKFGAGVGALAMNLAIAVALAGTGAVAPLLAGSIASAVVGAYNGIKCAVGAAKDGQGKLIKNW